MRTSGAGTRPSTRSSLHIHPDRVFTREAGIRLRAIAHRELTDPTRPIMVSVSARETLALPGQVLAGLGLVRGRGIA